jgi:uncharacterized hydantoinase/oxoprolinase family protein
MWGITHIATADNTLVLVVAEGALVTDMRDSRRSDVAVANWAFAVALVAEASDGDASLFAAHH